jgi:hypothetical protein
MHGHLVLLVTYLDFAILPMLYRRGHRFQCSQQCRRTFDLCRQQAGRFSGRPSVSPWLDGFRPNCDSIARSNFDLMPRQGTPVPGSRSASLLRTISDTTLRSGPGSDSSESPATAWPMKAGLDGSSASEVEVTVSFSWPLHHLLFAVGRVATKQF